MRPILIWLLVFTVALTAPAASDPMRACRQCVLVLAPNWNSTTGVLRTFERTEAKGAWRMRGSEIPVVLGKNGLGWGRGVLEVKADGPRKTEGDNRVPAGIFRLGPAFGYAPAAGARWIKLRYVPLTQQTEAIDDPRSHYYNQLVDRSKVARMDWHSSEKMRRSDALYKWGLIVAHNPTSTPGAGSCIFLHIWKTSATLTTGCTAMTERDLVKLLRWLDPNAHPILVQMPRHDYAKLQPSHRLPAIPEKPSR
jgi:L,D-peptidoglycan transpeptidase YkuD (ErfK/YbiS/YcfS/YnhG family)